MHLEQLLDEFLKRRYRINRDMEGILYHYTNLQALYAILATGSFWMTRSEFLNDASELKYIKTVIEKVLEDGIEEPCFDQRFKEETLSILNGSYFNAQHRSKCYILSMTSIPDLITNWSSYSNFDGYNLGIDSRELHRMLETKFPGAFMSGYVIYDEKNQREIIRQELEKFIFIWKGLENGNREDVKLIAHTFMSRMLNYSYFFKHPSFEPESEYRIAFFPDQANEVFNILFRTASGGLVPYIELDIRRLDDSTKLPVNEVWIGPTNKMDNAFLGLEAFLHSLGYKNVEIKKSVIPLSF